MIIISEKSILGSKSDARFIFNKIKADCQLLVNKNMLSLDWLTETTNEIEFFGELDFSALTIQEFNLIFDLLLNLHIDNQVTDKMQADPRFVEQKKVA